MNEREFCYWLQGLFEVGGVKALDETQVQIVKDHLALVFKKVTADRSGPDLAEIYRREMDRKNPVMPYRTTLVPNPAEIDKWVPYEGPKCGTSISGEPKPLSAIC